MAAMLTCNNASGFLCNCRSMTLHSKLSIESSDPLTRRSLYHRAL